MIGYYVSYHDVSLTNLLSKEAAEKKFEELSKIITSIEIKCVEDVLHIKLNGQIHSNEN